MSMAHLSSKSIANKNPQQYVRSHYAPRSMSLALGTSLALLEELGRAAVASKVTVSCAHAYGDPRTGIEWLT